MLQDINVLTGLDHTLLRSDGSRMSVFLEQPPHIRICGTGVAVSNAVMDVKAFADCVTLSNDEDGAADWIEKIYS